MEAQNLMSSDWTVTHDRHGPQLPVRQSAALVRGGTVLGATQHTIDEFVRVTGVCRALSANRPMLDLTVRTAGAVGSVALLGEMLGLSYFGVAAVAPGVAVATAAVAYGCYLLLEPSVNRPDHEITPRRMLFNVAACAVGSTAAVVALPVMVSGAVFAIGVAAGINVVAHNLVD